MEEKNRKPLVALLLVAVLGVVGVTIAYFSSTDVFTNVFSTKPYGVTVEEVFTSPTDWRPGTDTPKTINVTNTGQIPVAVRVKYVETWTTTRTNETTQQEETVTLPLQFGEVGSEESAAIIHFADNYTNSWNYSAADGYYYYKTALAAGATTADLITSVEFNPHVTGTVASDYENGTCTTSTRTVNGKTETVKTCATTISGYAGATYTLTITAETVQYDRYEEAWHLTP